MTDKKAKIDGGQIMAKRVKKAKPVKLRNKAVTDAWLRSGAGVMKDRRQPRGGAKSWRDHLDREDKS